MTAKLSDLSAERKIDMKKALFLGGMLIAGSVFADGVDAEAYEIYLVYHFKYYSHGDKECQQLLGSWIEIYFPERQAIAKIVELNEKTFSLVHDGSQVVSLKKGIEIIHLEARDEPYDEQRLEIHDDYRISEMPIRIDCLKLTNSTLRDVLEELE